VSGPVVLASSIARQTGVALANEEALVLVGHTVSATDVADVGGAGNTAALADAVVGDIDAGAGSLAGVRVGVSVSAADRSELSGANAAASAWVTENGVSISVARGENHARSGGAVAARGNGGHGGRALKMAGALVGNSVRTADEGGLAEALPAAGRRAGRRGDVRAAGAEDGWVVGVGRVDVRGLAGTSVEDALSVALQFTNACVGDTVGTAGDGGQTLTLLLAVGGVLGSDSGSEDGEDGGDSNLDH